MKHWEIFSVASFLLLIILIVIIIYNKDQSKNDNDKLIATIIACILIFVLTCIIIYIFYNEKNVIISYPKNTYSLPPIKFNSNKQIKQLFKLPPIQK